MKIDAGRRWYRAVVLVVVVWVVLSLLLGPCNFQHLDLAFNAFGERFHANPSRLDSTSLSSGPSPGVSWAGERRSGETLTRAPAQLVTYTVALFSLFPLDYCSGPLGALWLLPHSPRTRWPAVTITFGHETDSQPGPFSCLGNPAPMSLGRYNGVGYLKVAISLASIAFLSCRDPSARGVGEHGKGQQGTQWSKCNLPR